MCKISALNAGLDRKTNVKLMHVIHNIETDKEVHYCRELLHIQHHWDTNSW
jgi:hypothetical protein